MFESKSDHPPLIPAPVEYRSTVGQFLIDAATTVLLAPDAGDATQFSAACLVHAIRDATGIQSPIRRAREVEGGAGQIWLLVTGRDEVAPPSELGPEGYVVDLSSERVIVSGGGEAGLFYGVQTLCQLIRTQGRRLPAAHIRDWPALPNRGVMLDVSRGKVPTLETLYELANTLATYKYNHLQLYTEHTFEFPSHPEIGAGADSLSAGDMLALDRICRDRHIELVPNLQSFGHHRSTLNLPTYAHLDEVGWKWTLTPAREETYELLDDLYGDLLPAFDSRWLNVNCDETWDLGTGQSRALATEVGVGRVYLGHILRLRELAARHGRRIMLWADVLHHHPELLRDVPEDLILLDWSYEALERYPTTDTLRDSGREFWVCPGTSTWNTLFPRLDNALGNIRAYTRDGIAAGATGMLLTDWGDIGHYQALSLSWYPYLFGAATAWTGAKTAPEEFDRAFAPLYLGLPAGSEAMVALRRLGRAVAGPSIGLRNRSNSAYALFDDPLRGKLIDTADQTAWTELRDAAVAGVLAWAALPAALPRHDYTFTAEQVAFGAEKVLLGQRLRALLRTLNQRADRDVALSELDATIATLERYARRVPALLAEFEARWEAHARRSEIELTSRRYRGLATRYAVATAWLRDQRTRYASGEPIDAEAVGYELAGYTVLWDESRAALLELAETVGIDALPEQVRQILGAS